MKAFNVILLISIITLSAYEVVSEANYDCSILTKLKDDCGSVCGIINPPPERNNCGNPDKREHTHLLIHGEDDDGHTDYEEKVYLECVDKCPANYQVYKETKICVKDTAEFESFANGCASEEPSTNLWAIFLSIVGVVIGAGAAFAFYKKKIQGESRKESNEVRASEVGLTKESA